MTFFKNNLVIFLFLVTMPIISSDIMQQYNADEKDFVSLFSSLMQAYQSENIDCQTIVQELLHDKKYLDIKLNAVDIDSLNEKSLVEKQQAFAQDVMRLLVYIDSQGYSFTFGETMRTPEQAEIYAQQGIGIKNSLHCKRLAIDINLFDPSGNYMKDSNDHAPFGAYWKTLHQNNRWCGDFIRCDGNHYERQE